MLCCCLLIAKYVQYILLKVIVGDGKSKSLTKMNMCECPELLSLLSY